MISEFVPLVGWHKYDGISRRNFEERRFKLHSAPLSILV